MKVTFQVENAVFTKTKLDPEVRALDSFLFDYFMFIILDLGNTRDKNFSIPREDLGNANKILNRKRIKPVPIELRGLLIKAIACTIMSVKNRLNKPNPFNSIEKTSIIVGVLKKIEKIKKRRAITKVTFDEIKFGAKEIELLFGKKFEHLRIDSTWIFNFINTGTKDIDRNPDTVYKEQLAKSLNDSLKRLSIHETSPIISDIFYYGGFLDKHGNPLIASPNSISSYIRRGTTK